MPESPLNATPDNENTVPTDFISRLKEQLARREDSQPSKKGNANLDYWRRVFNEEDTTEDDVAKEILDIPNITAETVNRAIQFLSPVSDLEKADLNFLAEGSAELAQQREDRKKAAQELAEQNKRRKEILDNNYQGLKQILGNHFAILKQSPKFSSIYAEQIAADRASLSQQNGALQRGAYPANKNTNN